MLRSNTHLMQRVSECKLVVFCGAAAVRARPPAGRARPSLLHIRKALASKWYKRLFQRVGSLREEGGLSIFGRR